MAEPKKVPQKITPQKTNMPAIGTFAYNLLMEMDTANLLSEVKQTNTHNSLVNTESVLKQLSDMPRITPPAKPVRFSEISPTPKSEQESEAETQGKPRHRILSRLNPLRRRSKDE